MPHTDSLPSLSRLVLPFALGAGWKPRAPDLGIVETGMARAFDAIRTYARIAWWDGSAVGLRLHRFVGLFERNDVDPCALQEDRP